MITTTGVLGFHDGAAHQAKFRFGVSANYGAHNLACAPDGDVFVADSGNGRVRRIFERGGAWFVDTRLGGGDSRRSQTQATPQAVSLDGTIAVAVNSLGALFVATSHGYYRVSPDGARAAFLGEWPASTSRQPGKPARLNVHMGDADRAGNVYFVSRTPDVVIRIDAAGKATHLAGVVKRGPKPLHLGDGPPREVFFDTPNSLVADPDGAAVYVAGGDEYNIRRVPTDGVTTTATLGQDGRWHVARRHPNHSRGAALMLDARDARDARDDRGSGLVPDGDITVLIVNQMVGRDDEGGIHALLRSWRGRSQYVEGRGLIGTKVFRLRRAGGER